MIYAPVYAFHLDHAPGEPGTVRFLGRIDGETVSEIYNTASFMLKHDEVGIAYPHNSIGRDHPDSFEVWPSNEELVI